MQSTSGRGVREPLLDLGQPGTEGVHVPGGDPHEVTLTRGRAAGAGGGAHVWSTTCARGATSASTGSSSSRTSASTWSSARTSCTARSRSAGGRSATTAGRRWFSTTSVASARPSASRSGARDARRTRRAVLCAAEHVRLTQPAVFPAAAPRRCSPPTSPRDATSAMRRSSTRSSRRAAVTRRRCASRGRERCRAGRARRVDGGGMGPRGDRHACVPAPVRLRDPRRPGPRDDGAHRERLLARARSP